MPSMPAARSTPIPIPFPERRSPRRDRRVHAGLALAPDETVLWQGGPSWRGIAMQAFHAPVVGGYFGLLVAARLLRGGLGHGMLRAALAPMVLGAATLAIVIVLAALVARSTRYVVTDRRIVLRFGVGLPRSVSLPFAQVLALALASTRGGRGDIALTLRDPGPLSYGKLWPHVRPWRVRNPEPMLRDVPQAGMLASRLARLLAAAERERLDRPTEVPCADGASALG